MKYKTNSEEYETVRLSWPKNMERVCPICKGKMKFKHANAGKIVHTLHGAINQVTNLYGCTNQECERFDEDFNPHVRFDYSERRYGADVFRFISEEFLLYKSSIESIYLKLSKKYYVAISQRTVQRICDDILNLKAYIIDENTKKILEKDPIVLLGLDGQDPGGDGKALWLFIDLIHNRVLHTCLLDHVNFELLHEIIEIIKNEMGVKIIGFVSDKQNAIVKCCKTYYGDLPHQYCEYHFLRNTWNHAETLDSHVFLPLKKAINKLYIHTADKTKKVQFEGVGRVSVRKVFKEIDKDLQSMAKVRNTPFKRLRGIWIFDKLSEYVQKMVSISDRMNPEYRYTKIFRRTISSLKEALNHVQGAYKESLELFNRFQSIRELFGDKKTTVDEKINGLDSFYGDLWELKKSIDPQISFEDLKAFLPGKNRRFSEIVGEWYRLWISYKPGLFQYAHFPHAIKTNNGCERGFSQEKQMLYRRAGKKVIGSLIETRGEAYLRIVHCSQEELKSDIVEEYSGALIALLRKGQQDRISEVTKYWHKCTLIYRGYYSSLAQFYPNLSIEDENIHNGLNEVLKKEVR